MENMFVYMATTRMYVLDAETLMSDVSIDQKVILGEKDGLPTLHTNIPYRDDKLHMLAKVGSSGSIKRYLPRIKATYQVFGNMLFILEVDIHYSEGLIVDLGIRSIAPSGELLPKSEGWFGVEIALFEHKLLLDEFPHVPYFVITTRNDEPKAMTEDFLRKRWREISDVEGFPIIPYAGNENFREQFLKTVEAMVDR